MAKKEDIGKKSTNVVYFTYIGKMIGFLITAITFVIVTRLLGPSNYGLYTLAFGFAAFIDGFGNFGITSYFGRYVPKFSYLKDKEGVANVIVAGYSVLLLLALALTIIGLLASGYVANVLLKSHNIAVSTLMIASLYIFFLVAANTSITALVSLYKGKLGAAVTLAIDIVQLISCSSLVVLGYGVNGAVSGILIGYMVGAAFGVYYVFKIVIFDTKIKIKMPSKKEIKQVLTFSVPLGMNTFLNSGVVNFSTLFLGLYATASQLGNYGAALKGLAFASVAYDPINTALLPIFSSTKETKGKRNISDAFNNILNYSLIISLPLLIYIAVFSTQGISLLISNAYSNAPFYLTLMAIGSAVSILGFFLSSIIISGEYTKKILFYNVIETIPQVAVLLILVPMKGFIGGPVGTIISIYFVASIAADILFSYAAEKLFKLRLDYWKITRIFLANLVLGLVMALALFINHAVLTLVSGFLLMVISYPLILVMLNVIKGKDLEDIKKIGTDIPRFKGLINILVRYMKVFTDATVS